MTRAVNTAALLAIYHDLRAHFGPRNWWPAQSPFEVAVGAVLTQNTAWRNVVTAIDALRANDLLSPSALLATPEADLANLIRPSGYFNQKAKKLHVLARFIATDLDGDITRLAHLDPGDARQKLLALWGVGRETADSILLYAAGVPVFVIDAYTLRAGARLRLFKHVTRLPDYETARALFESRLQPDAALYNDYHAQWVALGHHYCKPTPRCDVCPLAPRCPHGHRELKRKAKAPQT